MAGANAVGLPVIIDGLNNKGLYVGTFYFPSFASYPEATRENQSRAMAPHEYATWLLGNFANVDEVKANFDKVVLLPVVLDAIKQAPPVHFVVHDRTGKSVVFEPIDRKLRIYDNPLGVVTNSPTFDWHTTNLRSYINLTAINVPPSDGRCPAPHTFPPYLRGGGLNPVLRRLKWIRTGLPAAPRSGRSWWRR